MKKLYNFWLIPQPTALPNGQPLSSVTATVKGAKDWATYLLLLNQHADGIKYKAENGRKTYLLPRMETD